MGKIIVDIILLIALPLVSFIGGTWIMSRISNYQQVTQQLSETNQKPLYLRLGYSITDVQRCWGALSNNEILSEKRFLELDLIFPFVYGGAFAISLLMA